MVVGGAGRNTHREEDGGGGRSSLPLPATMLCCGGKKVNIKILKQKHLMELFTRNCWSSVVYIMIDQVYVVPLPCVGNLVI